MDDEADGRRDSKGRGDDRSADLARGERPQRLQQFGSGGTMNRAVHAATANECGVCCSDKHLDLCLNNVAGHNFDLHSLIMSQLKGTTHVATHPVLVHRHS